MRSRVPLLVVLGLCLAFLGCIPQATTTVYSQAVPIQQITLPKFLEGFTLLTEAEETGVGRLVDSNGFFFGSGVLISPQWILTAGHCAVDTDVAWFDIENHRYCVDKVIVYPGFTEEDRLSIDLALLHLSTFCESPYRELHRDPLKRMAPLTVIGYGGDYKKRSNFGVCRYYGRLIEEPNVLKTLCYEGTVWRGDSGGAVLTYDGRLVGIVSSFGVLNNHIFENSSTYLSPELITWVEGNMLFD